MTDILITGGGGFLGQKLALKLAETGRVGGQEIQSVTLVDVIAPNPVNALFKTRTVILDISDPRAVQGLFKDTFDTIYHLAAIVSGQAEAEFDLGLQVNLFGTLNMLQAARMQEARIGRPATFIYASSVAAHGGDVPDPVPEGAELNPQTSYGTQKAMGELLVQDMSRRGIIDGRGLRLPTVCIRPGTANAAASSFISLIFRDTMQGHTANCPMGRDYKVWHTAPRTIIDNLIHAASVPAEAFGMNRNINLPGRTDTIGEMIAAMTRLSGPEAEKLITWNPDEAVAKIGLGWRGSIAHDKALRLGFKADRSFEDTVKWFLEDDIVGATSAEKS